MTQSEIKDEVLSKNPNITSEQYDLIIRDYYNGIRYYLTNPLESKGGILIGKLFSFSMSIKKMEKYLIALQNKEFKIRKSDLTLQNIEFYEKLKDQLRKYERQKSKKL